MKNSAILAIIFLSFISCKTNNKENLPEATKNNETILTSIKDTSNIEFQNYKTEYLTSNVNTLRSENKETNLIILGGGKNRIDAENIKQKYLSESIVNSQIRGIATISLSDTINGLKPGFYITTIGCLNNKFKTNMVVRYAKNYLEGVYSREIKLKKNQFNTIGSEIDFKPETDYDNSRFQPYRRDDLDLMPKLIVNCNEEGDIDSANYKETCVYKSGIIREEERFYEGFSKKTKYPLKDYKFYVVLDYIMHKKKAFNSLLEYDNLKDIEEGKYQNEWDENEEPKIKVLEDQEIKIEQNHYSEHIYIKDGYIVYINGGGV